MTNNPKRIQLTNATILFDGVEFPPRPPSTKEMIEAMSTDKLEAQLEYMRKPSTEDWYEEFRSEDYEFFLKVRQLIEEELASRI